VEGIKSTTGYYFNLTNKGNVPLSIEIKASNATNSTTGFQWTLNATPDYNKFSLLYNKSGVEVWKNINLTYDAFVDYLNPGDYQTFDLKILMATTSSKKDLVMHIQLTFRSVIA